MIIISNHAIFFYWRVYNCYIDRQQQIFNSVTCVYTRSTSSNTRGPAKFVLVMRCSIYEFALHIKCKYNVLSGDRNHLSELTGFLS